MFSPSHTVATYCDPNGAAHHRNYEKMCGISTDIVAPDAREADPRVRVVSGVPCSHGGYDMLALNENDDVVLGTTNRDVPG